MLVKLGLLSFPVLSPVTLNTLVELVGDSGRPVL